GCDHGFMAIELVSRGISPKVIASDLRTGPLERARENIEKAGLSDKISLIISDGFSAIEPGSVKTAVIAGMGGMLIRDILTNGMDCIKQMDEFIVQPQSNIPEFRNFLRQSGFEIKRNNVLIDAGKYYFPMRIKYTGKTDENPSITPEDRYGADLIKEDRGLSDYLGAEMSSYEKILEKLISESGEHNERTEEIRELMELNRSVRSRINKE
ncbi:MAG: SAM-dependent methyltransferase, partial [Lachnospiraceae bacterium]|nr:SAM-dependent methyltransferase [Lachnospiraceae bacterium]